MKKTIELFLRDADEIINEFEQYIDGRLDIETALIQGSLKYDKDELAKLHRKVWQEHARKMKSEGKEVPDGWLVEYQNQEDDHKAAQRKQAFALFAAGYEAAITDMRKPEAEAASKELATRSSSRSTIQAFTAVESRIMLAALMALLTDFIRNRKVTISTEAVTRLISKLSVIADIDISTVEYFAPSTHKVAQKMSPKFKPRPKKTFKKRRGLGHMTKRARK